MFRYIIMIIYEVPTEDALACRARRCFTAISTNCLSAQYCLRPLKERKERDS